MPYRFFCLSVFFFSFFYTVCLLQYVTLCVCEHRSCLIIYCEMICAPHLVSHKLNFECAFFISIFSSKTILIITTTRSISSSQSRVRLILKRLQLSGKNSAILQIYVQGLFDNSSRYILKYLRRTITSIYTNSYHISYFSGFISPHFVMLDLMFAIKVAK